MSVASETKKAVKGVTSPDWKVVGGFIVGTAILGGLVYAIRRAPTNAVTGPVKTAAEVVTSA